MLWTSTASNRRSFAAEVSVDHPLVGIGCLGDFSWRNPAVRHVIEEPLHSVDV
jgi:hypothetical protein